MNHVTHHLPRLLDLFCCAGGAGMGYRLAGFDVWGVDKEPQPNYPFAFVRTDALALDPRFLAKFDVIHASPPCQSYLKGTLASNKGQLDLVAPTREMLERSGKLWVLENVMGAPLIKERSIVLCGSMFGLRTYRHRRFESNMPLVAPAHPEHVARVATKQRKQRWAEGWNASITGDVGTYVGPEAMGVDWMTGNELSEAIPPAYTQHIGAQALALMARLERLAA